MSQFDQHGQHIARDQYNAGRDIHIIAPLSLTDVQQRRNRSRMLERVYAFWINGVLKQSLRNATLIILDLHEQSDLIENPWRLTLQESDQPMRYLPSGTSISQVYDEAGRELLILGEPGSGKTTLLLELTRDLLECARHEDTLPMPVVFNLSSWTVKRQPLTDWLIEELESKYQVPRQLGRLWIDADQILPLLDGLDEVVEKHRTACVDAINTYHRKHGLHPMVVCSRSAEYLAQTTRVLVRRAVIVQPLTMQQINDYLEGTEGQLEALRVVLRDNLVLQELARTPLMLSVLTLAYRGKSVGDVVKEGSIETQKRQIFAAYIQRMLERRTVNASYRPQQTIHWLAWLAKQLVQHSQTEFYIERMQPDWLPSDRSRRLYRAIVIEAFVILLFILLVEIVAWVLFGVAIGTELRIGIGIITGVVAELITMRIREPKIEPAEAMTWSWRGRRNSIVLSLVGLIIGLGIGILIDKNLLITSLAGMLFGLSWTIPDRLTIKLLDKQSLITPNRGIWNSARNGLLAGSLDGLIFGLSFTLFLFNSIGLTKSSILGIIVGLSIALITGLMKGMDSVIDHFVLRLFLWNVGFLPWNYIQFLDYATERILLRKVGGGYIFIHRMLMEYFASLYQIDTK